MNSLTADRNESVDDQYKTAKDNPNYSKSAQARTFQIPMPNTGNVTDPLTDGVSNSCRIVTFQKDQKHHDSHTKQNDIDSSNSDMVVKNDWDFSKIIDMINKAKQPVIIAGKGCNSSSALLREFAITGNIPVTTTLHGMGCFDETHPLALQMLGMLSSFIIQSLPKGAVAQQYTR